MAEVVDEDEVLLQRRIGAIVCFNRENLEFIPLDRDIANRMTDVSECRRK